MKYLNITSRLKTIFLPTILLSLFLCMACGLLQFSQSTLLAKEVLLKQIPNLKTVEATARIILTLILVFFGLFKPFETIFRATLIGIKGALVFSLFCYFFQDQLVGQESMASIATSSSLLIFWPTSLIYVTLGLFNYTLLSLMIWGQINHLCSISEGLNFYIPFSFLLGTCTTILTRQGSSLLSQSQLSLFSMSALAITFLALGLHTFNWFWKRSQESTHTSGQDSTSLSKFPYLSAAYIIVSLSMIKSFLDMIFKFLMKGEFPNPTNYNTVLAKYSTDTGYLTLILSTLWVALGTWMIIKKGWKKTFLYAALSTLVAGLLFLSLSFSWIHFSVFNAFIISLSSTLMFPLVQILYLYLPQKKRFKTKLITEMIYAPILKTAPSLTTQGLLVGLGSIAAITVYLKALAFVLMILLPFIAIFFKPIQK